MNPTKCKAPEDVAQELEDLNWMIGYLQYLASRANRGEDIDQIAVLTQEFNISRSLKIIRKTVKDALQACGVNTSLTIFDQ